MMDTPLAMLNRNLELKVQTNQGGKGGKSDKQQDGASFRDALSGKIDLRKNQLPVADGKAAAAEPEQGVTLQPTIDIGNSPAKAEPAPQIQVSRQPLDARINQLAILDRKAVPNEADAPDKDTRGELGDKLTIRIDRKAADRKAATAPDLKPALIAETEEKVESGPVESDMALPAGKAPASLARKGKAGEDNASAGETEDGSAGHVLAMLQDDGKTVMPVADNGRHLPQQQQQPQGETAAAEDEASSGATYRIARADGKGGVVEIPAEREAPAAAKAAPADGFNQVTVIEQRRYLAPAQDNALAVVKSITGNPEWTSALQPESALANAAEMAGSGKVVNTLKIQMHPIELGLVTATLRLQGEELSVELKVDNGAAFKHLKDDQSKIIESLKAHGFSIDQVNITLASDRADTSAGNQSGNQGNGQNSAFAQQQQARDGGQGAAAGRDRRAYQQERTSNGAVKTDEVRTDAAGSAGGRSQSVYL